MSDQLALLESPPESLEDPFVAGEEQGITEVLMDDVLETMQTVVEDAERARKDRDATMRMAACVVWEAASKTARYKDKLLHGPMGIPQMERDEAIVASALDNFRYRARDDGKGGRAAGEAARHMSLDEMAKKFIAETPANLIDDLSSTVREALSAVEPDSLGEKLGSAAMVIVALAAALSSPVANVPQEGGLAERPPGASASAFPTGSEKIESEAKKIEDKETQKRDKERPARAVAIGDSVTSMAMGRVDVEGKTQTHEEVEDKWGKSKVGALPEDVLGMIKEWDETKGFDGVEVQVSPGAANNPAGIEKALPEMIDVVAGSGALGMVITGVPEEPPKDGIYQEAGALMREYDTNNQMAEIVRQAQEKHPDFKITFTGGYKTGPDNLHPSDSELDALRQTDAMQKIRDQQVADYTAAVERAEAKEQAENLAKWNKAVADAENEKILNEAVAEARAEEDKNMGFDESLIGGVKVKVNPESKSADLSPEVFAFNAELRRLVDTGEQDVSALSLLYQAVYNANDTGEAPEGYVKVFLPHEVKGLLPQLTVAAKTSPSEMYTRPEMAAATYLTATRFSKLIAEKYPQYTGQMIRARDYNSANHGSHNSGLDWDISVARGYAPTEVSDGSALDFAGLDGAGEYDRDLTIDLIVIMGQIQAWDGDLFKYLLYEDSEALAAANGTLGRTFVQIHEYHSDHGHLGINRERSLGKFHPKPPWSLETDLHIGGGAVPLTDEEKQVYDGYMEWIDSWSTPPPAPEAPETTTTTEAPEATTTTETPEVDDSEESTTTTETPEVNQPEAPVTTEAPTTTTEAPAPPETTEAPAPPETTEAPEQAPEAIDELANYRPLFDLIARGESDGNYNAYYGNATNSDEHFTSMTIQQVIEWQADYVAGGSPSSAVGKYQMMQETLNEMVNKHGVDPNALFDEAMQDELAINLLEKRGLSKYLSGELSPEQFAAKLAMEWAALPKVLGDNPGDSYYQGDGLNKSSIGVEEFLAAVNQIK